MAFDWLDYLTLAQELIQHKPSQFSVTNTEARHRAAISRAYYAVYHLAKRHLASHGPYYSFFGIEKLGHVYNQFQRGPTDKHLDFGNTLAELYEYRAKSDYELNNRWLTPNTAKFIIAMAVRLVQDLDEIKKIDVSSARS